jgi:hypothetical protein
MKHFCKRCGSPVLVNGECSTPGNHTGCQGGETVSSEKTGPSTRVQSITQHPYQFACQWYKAEEIHRSILSTQNSLGLKRSPPGDVFSQEFAEFLAEEYRLAMTKGAELAIAEMRDSHVVT